MAVICAVHKLESFQLPGCEDRTELTPLAGYVHSLPLLLLGELSCVPPLIWHL